MFSVSEASRICENPTEADYKNLMNILQYLKGTKNKSIHYNKDNKFIGYSDSDFANDEKTRRYINGYIFLLGKSPISWKSQLQEKRNSIYY
jgi:murein tripeptide amidase MpaA